MMTDQSRPLPQRHRLRALRAAMAVGVAVTTAVAVVTLAPPSQAATCGGYVALTYDDGPIPGNTLQLLDALKKAHVRATLFNRGEYAAATPSLVTTEKAAGMWIGNHSWSHPHMTQLTTAQMASEISRTQDILQQQTNTKPVLFRPPFGTTNSTVRSVERQYGLTEVLWDLSAADYDGRPVSQIVAIAHRATNGQVILMHDHHPNTVAAIPQIVADLTSRNLCAGMISPATGRAVAPTPEGPGPSPSPSTPPSPGDSPVSGTTYKIKNVATGRYLDSESNGALTLAAASSYDDQDWVVTQQSDGSWTIKNVRSGRYYLDTAANNAVVWNSGAVGPESQWLLQSASGGFRLDNERSDRAYLYGTSAGEVRWNTGATDATTVWALERK